MCHGSVSCQLLSCSKWAQKQQHDARCHTSTKKPLNLIDMMAHLIHSQVRGVVRSVTEAMTWMATVTALALQAPTPTAARTPPKLHATTTVAGLLMAILPPPSRHPHLLVRHVLQLGTVPQSTHGVWPPCRPLPSHLSTPRHCGCLGAVWKEPPGLQAAALLLPRL